MRTRSRNSAYCFALPVVSYAKQMYYSETTVEAAFDVSYRAIAAKKSRRARDALQLVKTFAFMHWEHSLRILAVLHRKCEGREANGQGDWCQTRFFAAGELVSMDSCAAKSNPSSLPWSTYHRFPSKCPPWWLERTSRRQETNTKGDASTGAVFLGHTQPQDMQLVYASSGLQVGSRDAWFERRRTVYLLRSCRVINILLRQIRAKWWRAHETPAASCRWGPERTG